MAAATKSVSIRLALDGKPEVKSGLNEVGRAGEDAGKQIAKGADLATAAAERQAQKWRQLAAAARQASSQTASQSAAQSSFNQALGITSDPRGSVAGQSAAFFKAQAQAAEDLAQRSAALRAQIDPLGAAEKRMNLTIAESAALLKARAISETEHTAAVALAKKEFAAAEQSLRRFAASGAMSNAQVMALTGSIRHMADSVIAGQSPLRALAAQGGHLSFALGGGVGVSGVMMLVKQGAQALVSPLALTVGGFAAVAGVAVTAAAAYRGFIQDQKALEAALSGVGRASGATVLQMEQIANSAASAGGISVASAREMEEQFAQTGKIGVEQFSGLIGIVRNYAATTHESVNDATKELAAAFAEPAKGVDLLNSRVGGLDDKTRQYIMTLAATGDRQAAQIALLKALIPQLDDAGTHTDALGRSWDGVWRSASNAWDAIKGAVGAAVNGPDLAMQMKALRDERARAQADQGLMSSAGSVPVQLAPRPLQSIDTDIAAIQAKIDALGDHARSVAHGVNASAQSIAVGNLARSVLGFGELDNMINQQKELNKQLADPAVRSRVADLKQAEDAQNAYSRAIATYLTPAQKAAALADIESKALNDRTPAQKADTAAKREAIEIAGKLMTTEQASADVSRARSKALNEASKAEQTRAAEVSKETRVLDANTASALESARAWLTSAAAGMQADAARKAMTDSIKKGSDAESRSRQILQQSIADLAESGAKEADSINARTAAQRRANDAVAAGAIGSEQARDQVETELALRPRVIAQAVAEGDVKSGLTKTIQALTKAYAESSAEQRRAQAVSLVENQRLGISLLRQEIEIQGEGDLQREQELAVLQAKSELLRQHIDLASLEGQEYVENARLAAGLNQKLQLIAESRQELSSLFDTLIGDADTFFRNGKFGWSDWGDLAKNVLLDVESEMFKLAAINPLKNALLGGNSPTLDSVGGIIGSLFGGGGNLSSVVSQSIAANPLLFHTGGNVNSAGGVRRTVPENVLRFAPRFHSGAMLGPDEVPAILQTGERVLNRTETKAYNSNASTPPARIEIVFKAANDGGADAAASAQVTNSGGFDLTAMVDTATAKNMGNPNSQTSKVMRSRFGTSPKLIAR